MIIDIYTDNHMDEAHVMSYTISLVAGEMPWLLLCGNHNNRRI